MLLGFYIFSGQPQNVCHLFSDFIKKSGFLEDTGMQFGMNKIVCIFM